jgi:TRAP-type C4-dicarboxylate transport system permease small subunit
MRIQEFERRLTAALEAALAAGMLVVVLLIVVLVTMRYLFESGLVGANEIATVVFVYLSSLGTAVAVGRQEHIRVDLLLRRSGPRGKLALEIASLALVGLLNAVVLACSVPWIAKTGQVPMPATQIPRYLAQASVPLGCGLAALYCCTRIAVLVRREPAS